MGNYLVGINLGSINVQSFNAGGDHTCLLATSGYLYCFGSNDRGQLGQGHSLNIGNSANEMGEYLQITSLGIGRRVRVVTGGTEHTCVILDNYEVKCFGYNNFGQLGYGDISNRGDVGIQWVNISPSLTWERVKLLNISILANSILVLY